MDDESLPADIRARLEHRLGASARLQVTPDPFRGVRILAISSVFDGMSPWQRRDLVMSEISDDDIAHMELLTPMEAELLLPAADVEPTGQAALPLWPEALLRGQQERIRVNFASKGDEPLASPVVATFYSLRGGVGRSTALAYTALSLAETNRVLCIDMDLEAPGLAALFGVEPQVQSGTGVVPLLLQAEMSGQIPDLANHLVRVHDRREIYLLPAGQPGADYARQLGQLDPSAWYREAENPLRLLLKSVRELRFQPQIVLIDSRTGISPIAAPLLFDVADLAIVTFFPHPQTKLGTGALTRGLLASHTWRSTADHPLSPEIRFVVSPIPGAGSQELRAYYVDRAVAWVSAWLAPARTPEGDPAFEDVEELIHPIAHSEDLASSDLIDGVSEAFEPVAGWIAGFVDPLTDTSPQRAPFRLPAEDKSPILDDLKFSTGTAEDQSEDEFNQTFMMTDVVDRAIRVDIPLVLGRKGSGKTALFRRLAGLGDATVVISPTRLPTSRLWMPSSEVYSSVGNELDDRGYEWRVFWQLYIGIVLKLTHPEAPGPNWVSNPLACETRSESSYTRIELVEDVRVLLQNRDAPLLGSQWLAQVDSAISHPAMLLFDGLDTGFGLAGADLERRRRGISGLLSVVMSQGDEFSNLSFKIMLRDDLWRDVSIPNKSHLYGREVRLAWSDQTDYLRVAVKQAFRSTRFSDLVVDSLGRPGLDLKHTAVEFWPEATIYDAWVLLVGERVSGGKTAFTYNWVWSRLSDGNGDHSPRALLQLFNEATLLEQRLNQSNPYTRSLLRPRSVVSSLERVSEEAADALREEFPELHGLLRELERIGKTPFPAEDLQVDSGVQTLALDVGLLSVDIGNREDAERYRVPEVYRRALGMGRRGQL